MPACRLCRCDLRSAVSHCETKFHANCFAIGKSNFTRKSGGTYQKASVISRCCQEYVAYRPPTSTNGVKSNNGAIGLEKSVRISQSNPIFGTGQLPRISV